MGRRAQAEEEEDEEDEDEGEEGGWKVGPEDFSPLCVIGQGAFGRVLQVRSKLDEGVYAMKVISKRMLRKKNHLEEHLILLKTFILEKKRRIQNKNKK
jgi:serine/threonine protein kinase